MWDTFRNFHRECHEKMEEMQKFGGLRIWILHVLDEHGPGNGVEIMDSIQEHQHEIEVMRFGGRSKGFRTHRPSPGSVYPMLKKMVEEDLINKREDGKYELTEKGAKVVSKLTGRLKHFRERERGIIPTETALKEIGIYVSYLEDIKKSKLETHKEMIGELSERLKKIEESLNEE
ncbi:MAG: Transcriptional regulator PadR-like family protein [Methanobacterium sp. PtaU1.Bin097]|jgi:DNA-binding PadR family transcriptional regulator|nr:MAG: Transcriptional regulator PadR-like family protein [Methanobacterium sp. PtaU1.Bin097]